VFTGGLIHFHLLVLGLAPRTGGRSFGLQTEVFFFLRAFGSTHPGLEPAVTATRRVLCTGLKQLFYGVFMPPPFDLLPGLLSGVVVTVQLTLGAAVVAFVAAFIAGLGRFSRSRLQRSLAKIYVDIFRGTSALVQLFWVYFGLPLLGISLDAMAAGILVLGLNVGAYGSEVVRGAIKSVPREQVEAAVALNLSERQTLWYIVLPQAVLFMIPPFGNLLIELLKGTALVSLITLSELTFRGQMLRTAMFRSGEIFGVILLLYFLLSLMITFGMRRLERRLAIGQDYGGVE